MSVYVNVLADDPTIPSEALELVFDRTVLYHFFIYLSKSKMRKQNKDEERLLDQEKNACVKNHLLRFVEDHVDAVSADILQEWRLFPRRPATIVCGRMAAVFKRHVTENSKKRVQDHFKCLVEQNVWPWREITKFKYLL